jgi:hypothetical protein
MYAYDQSSGCECEGAVSALVSFAGVCEPESMLGRDGFPVEDPDTPVHCGSLMELWTPAVGPLATGYSLEPPAEPVRLPPVWRCSCGFQLDAWDGPFFESTLTGPVSVSRP